MGVSRRSRYSLFFFLKTENAKKIQIQEKEKKQNKTQNTQNWKGYLRRKNKKPNKLQFTLTRPTEGLKRISISLVGHV